MIYTKEFVGCQSHARLSCQSALSLQESVDSLITQQVMGQQFELPFLKRSDFSKAPVEETSQSAVSGDFDRLS